MKNAQTLLIVRNAAMITFYKFNLFSLGVVILVLTVIKLIQKENAHRIVKWKRD